VHEERVQDLLALLLEERLDEAGQRELAACFESDPKLAGEALELWLQETRIRSVLAGRTNPEPNVGRVLEKIRASLPAAEAHVRSVLARVGGSAPRRTTRRSRRYGGRPGLPWAVPAVLAAGALFAVVLWIVARPSRPEARVSRPAGAPKEELREKAEEPKGVAGAPVPPPPVPAPPPRPAEPERGEPAPKPDETPKPPVPVPAPKEGPPAPEKPAPPPAPAPTAPAVATLERVEGAVSVLSAAGRAPARPGDLLLGGQGLDVGAAGRATLKFPDGTRVDLEPETRVKEFTDAAGKRVQVERGAVAADVTRQPAGKAMTFATPHGEATVLGTTLRIKVDETSTRLEVTEGKVRLKRLSDGTPVEVVGGYLAVAGAGIDLAPRPIPVDEIVLGASHGKVFGLEWRRVKDERSAFGEAFEALETAAPMPRTSPSSPEEQQAAHRARQDWFVKGKSRSWVAFSFPAEADKEYRVWVRGECRWTGKGREFHDAVMMQVTHGRFVNRPKDWPPYPDEWCVFGGFAEQPGYRWSGGQDETGWTQAPISVRFNASGRQTLLIHAAEAPMRIDAVWLSASQKTRPDPQSTGPGKR
jgi:ferric-dicitrate binding protein FerR (iron transport regulator)